LCKLCALTNIEKMKNYILIIFFFTIISGCCKDELVESYGLNEFEKTLIPYNSLQDLKFIDEEGNIFIANSQPKESVLDLDRAGPESCEITEFEVETSFLDFQSKNISIKLELVASDFTDFILRTSNSTPNLNERFDLACEGLFSMTIEERLTNLTIDSFEYQNVLVFQNCSESIQIEKIIYSLVNGIEFIKFNEGKWLKLNE